MIHKIESHFVISSGHVWRPGAYDTEKTARRAFKFSDKQLQVLQDSINPGGIITSEMLNKLGKKYDEDTY